MCDQWMPDVHLLLTPEQYRQLPRNAAYKYEYLGGQAFLNPRPKHYHALLDLKSFAVAQAGIAVRRLQAAEVLDMAPLFATAFEYIQPFGGLDDETRLRAARQALERTLTGNDGPWIQQASYMAQAAGHHPAIGAILITLLPQGDPTDWDSYSWKEPPPSDCLEQRHGRPHLTWIFVSPAHAGRGIGTALLAIAARELLALGYHELLSTFMIGNDSSMLWHWRNGFQLLSYPGSLRRLHQRWR